jgi:glutathione synthase/RimK-type ligase-like ATP-grasp enzyme
MKKIGILFGMENTFPQAFIDRVNSKGETDIIAEAVTIEKVVQAEPTEYAVIIDRISQDVPFYRAYLKNAAMSGTAVINNPFWWSADEKFFNSALAEKIGVPVPKTALLPSKERPTDTTETSFRNLAFPLAWEEIFNYVGFPAYMKPHDGGGWRSVYKVNDPQDMWNKHEETGQLIMMLQEEIVFDDYVRCYCIGQKDVLIMPYEPRNPHHLRYAAELNATGEAREKLLETIRDYVLKLNIALGYDFNTVEFAVRNGIPFAIDFCNPAPDADVYSVGHENFEWVVEAVANMAIDRAKKQVPGKINLTWGTFVSDAVKGLLEVEQKTPVPQNVISDLPEVEASQITEVMESTPVPVISEKPKAAPKKPTPKAPKKKA